MLNACTLGGGGWEAIFRNSVGVQGTMGWCEKAQCAPGSCFSLSCCANVLSWVSSEGFAVVTTDLNIEGVNRMFYTQLNSSRSVCDRCGGRNR